MNGNRHKRLQDRKERRKIFELLGGFEVGNTQGVDNEESGYDTSNKWWRAWMYQLSTTNGLKLLIQM